MLSYQTSPSFFLTGMVPKNIALETFPTQISSSESLSRGPDLKRLLECPYIVGGVKFIS